MQFTKHDIMILRGILKSGGVNELKSITINKLIEATKVSHTKIRSTIRMMLSLGYVKEGFMQRNAKSYYITKEGVQLLNELMGEHNFGDKVDLSEVKGGVLNE